MIIDARKVFRDESVVYYCTEYDENTSSKKIAVVPFADNGGKISNAVIPLNDDPLYRHWLVDLHNREHTRYNAFYTLAEAVENCGSEDNILKITMESETVIKNQKTIPVSSIVELTEVKSTKSV